MINITICRNKEGCISSILLTGHAGFKEEGRDIVCAAVSVLVINTVNALEALTDTAFRCDAEEETGGYLQISFPHLDKTADHDACLLLRCMVLGLQDLNNEYSDYLIINNTLNEGGV